ECTAAGDGEASCRTISGGRQRTAGESSQVGTKNPRQIAVAGFLRPFISIRRSGLPLALPKAKRTCGRSSFRYSGALHERRAYERERDVEASGVARGALARCGSCPGAGQPPSGKGPPEEKRRPERNPQPAATAGMT